MTDHKSTVALSRVNPVAEWAPAAQEAVVDDADSMAVASSSTAAGEVPVIITVDNKNRFRSMSHSLLGRRPRPESFMLSPAHHDALTAQFGDLSVQSNTTNAATNTNRHGHARSASVAATESFKGIIRRASMSLKGIVHKRPSIAQLDVQHAAHAHPSRPVTSHTPSPSSSTSTSTWQRLRQAAHLRHQRISHGAELERPRFADTFPTVPTPGSGSEPPFIPHNTGAAAKAAAAAQNESLGYGRQSWLPSASSATLSSSPPAALRNRTWLGDLGVLRKNHSNDRESGIGIVVTSPEDESVVGAAIDDDSDVTPDMEQDANISRIDFVARVPVELAIHILACLDGPALANASLVSRRWNTVVASQHVWREAFLRAKTVTYATSGSVAPGRALGVPAVAPGVDWRDLYRIKEELDHSWKVGSAKPIYLNGHQDSIYCLQFDESKIVTGSRDRTIRIWDMRTLECRLVIGPPAVVNDASLLLDPNGQPMHYACRNDDEHDAERVDSFPARAAFTQFHDASILCLQYDDRILVTGSSDGTCIVHDVAAGYRPIRRLRHHAAAVLDLAFDERHIVTCSKDHTICVWDRESGRLLRQLAGHGGPVNAVQLRGNTIVSCSGDFRVKLWNVDTGKCIREFVGHNKGLACSQFTEDGRFVASAGNDKVIRIWDANTGECLREIKAHDNLVRSLHVDSVSGRLVSGSYDTDIKVFDMETGRQLIDFPRWHASWVLSAKSDYRRIVSTGQDPKILIMDFGAAVRGVEALESMPPLQADLGPDAAAQRSTL